MHSKARTEGKALIESQSWEALAVQLRLSPREIQIVQFVFDDHTESHIAERIGISPHTVHTYLSRIYSKLNVASRVQLVTRVFGEYMNLLDCRVGAAVSSVRPST